jgi:hypothetical protein
MPEDSLPARFVEALRPVPGLAALVLGGSRGRGAAGPASDYDLGLYYRQEAPLDIEALRSAVAPLADDPAFTLTGLGEWGPWIDGGAWLTSGGAKIDLLYRDLGRVREVVAQVLFALNGRYLINEKGAIGEAAAFPITLPGLAGTQAAIWRDIGADDLDGALRRLQRISDDLRPLL